MARKKSKNPCGLGWLLIWLLTVAAAPGQQPFGTGTTPPAASTPPSLAPMAPTSPPASTLQAPTYDPYSTQPGSSFGVPPLLTSPPPPSSSFGAPPSAYSQPYSLPSPGAQPYAAPPAAGFGTSPPALFPFGLQGPGQPATAFPTSSPLKFLQNLRLSDDLLFGDSTSAGDMRINDTFATSTIAFPNFLWTGQPWFLSPGFGYHAWSGPFGTWPDAGGVGQFYPQLPADAYSAFLDVGWRSSPDRAFGAELGGRIGVYSDFDSLADEAFRPMGLALLRYNLTPTLALKGGVSYINRADIKMLPAGGITWTPTPKRKWDIFFPQPKLSQYLTTLGTRDLWWYVAGEYGGGVWSVDLAYPNLATADPADFETARTLMDINDIRVTVGFELGSPANSSVGQKGLFFEVGYVWNREMVLVVPVQTFSLNDTWMLRGGFTF